MKTENANEVGMHRFERAGLGKAPYSFTGSSENVIRYPDGSTKSGGTCDFCGTGIRTECHLRSADGRDFKVGCDCIAKAGDIGLLKAYKTSPEYRKHQAQLRDAKNKRVAAEIAALLAQLSPQLSTMPHPRGFTDRRTGAPLTALDQATWEQANCGAAGRTGLLKWLKSIAV